MAIEGLEREQLVHFAQGASGVLGRLRQFVALAEAEGGDTAIAARVHGAVRRLLDMLERTSTFDALLSQITEEQRDLLVSVGVHELAAVDTGLMRTPDLPADEAAWYERKRSSLLSRCVELAAREARPLACVHDEFGQTRSSQEAIVRISQKLGHAPATAAPTGRQEQPPYDSGLPGRSRPAHGAPGSGAPPASVIGSVSPPSAVAAQPMPTPMSPTGTHGSGPGRAEALAARGATPVGQVLDQHAVRDPSLRQRVEYDLQMFTVAAQGGNHREAFVKLFAACEGVLIDYAAAHRDTLGLAGDPQQWSIEALMVQLSGERYRAYLASLAR